MLKIEKITVYHGRLEPDNPRSWKLNMVRVDAGGISGWGEAAPTYAPSAVGVHSVMSMLAERAVIGKNPMKNINIWRQMSGAVDGCYNGGMVGFGAVAALDVALWDLKAKLLGLPIHSLMGGALQRNLRCYANGWAYDISENSEYADAAKNVVNSGFTAMKFDPFRYDKGGFKAVPKPGNNLTRKWMKIALDRVEAVRNAVGPENDIIIEAHSKFPPDIAIELGRRLAEYDILYFEEPIRAENASVLRRVADQQPIPVAGGERLVRFEDLLPYVEQQSFALAQPDLGVVGGITPSKRMADYCETRQIHYQSHNSALGLNTAAIVQLSATLPNFMLVECFAFRPKEWYGLLENPYELRIKDGFMEVTDDPGLGVTVDETWINKRLEKTVITE